MTAPLARTIRCSRLIDGTGADPTGSVALRVEDGRIAAVGSAAGGHGDDLDLGGLTVLPGLIDAHSHLGLVGAAAGVPAALTAARIFRNAGLALAAGFTTVRDVGGIDGGVARAVAEGLVPGPRILPSGPIISRTGGHGCEAPPFAPFPDLHDAGLPGLTKQSASGDGPDELRRIARTALGRGATQLKVAVTGGFADYRPGIEETELSVAELMAVVEEADAAATYVTAHAHHSAGIRHGLSAGVACFEHGTFLDEQTAQQMAAAGAALVPTLAVIHLMRDLPDEELAARARLYETSMGEAVRTALAAGVLVGSGSDITGVEQDRRGLELALRARVVDPLLAIRMATANNARILRRSADVGTLEVGRLADLVAVDGDPLAEPELFDDPRRVLVVVQGGRVVKDIR